jgi:hypothetical protein
MRKLSVIIIALIFLTAVHVISLGKITDKFKQLSKGEESSFMIPAPILKIVTLDFHGIASDYLFLNALVFVGSTYERTERPRIKPWEWKWLYGTLDASTVLDPYFLDPYYFANGQLTWDALMIEEDNLLLAKGSQYREWDFSLPFYIGFNYFYFLQDNLNARTWLIEASRRPGAPPLYASLAGKLDYEKKHTENAINFIEEMSKRTEDEALKKKYETRLDFLRQVLKVENAVESFKKRFGRKPPDMQALIRMGMLQETPIDPYGGQFYLNGDSKVKSTSELQPEFFNSDNADVFLQPMVR